MRVEFCGIGEHFGRGVPATAYGYARSEGCTVNIADFYMCADHVPTVAEVRTHNEEQGTTLLEYHAFDIATGNPLQSFNLYAIEAVK